jgi:hypothetical protein
MFPAGKGWLRAINLPLFTECSKDSMVKSVNAAKPLFYSSCALISLISYKKYKPVLHTINLNYTHI